MKHNSLFKFKNNLNKKFLTKLKHGLHVIKRSRRIDASRPRSVGIYLGQRWGTVWYNNAATTTTAPALGLAFAAPATASLDTSSLSSLSFLLVRS
jgi:hypothetical protein